MKRVYLLFLLFLSLAGHSQIYFEDIIDNYYGKNPREKSFISTVKQFYRVSPFEGKFSGFIRTLTTDPEVAKPMTSFKTDTSLFAFSGEYPSFNPTSVKASKVLIKLQETDEQKQGIINGDTVYAYQITAFYENTAGNRKFLKQEFEKTNKKLKKNFSKFNQSNLKGFQNVIDGELMHYFWVENLTPPITFSWQELSGNQLALMMMLRLEVVRGYGFPTGINVKRNTLK